MSDAAGAFRRNIEANMQDTLDQELDSEIKTTKKAPTKTMPAAKAVTAPATVQQFVDPFARYGELEGSTNFFNGDFAKLDQKLGYIRGQSKTPLDVARGWVTNMMGAAHGYVKFAPSGEGRPEHDVYLIHLQPDLPKCKACGFTAREHDEVPKRCDWKPTVYLPLRSLDDPSDVVCFTGTGKGARIAVGELSKVYGRPGADRGGRDFVVLLETHSFPNKEKGTTVWPVFHQIGVEFFVPNTPAPEAAPVPIASTAKALPKRGDMNDEIPFN